MVCLPTPARAATASMVSPSNPRSSSSSRVAVTIAVRDFSLRLRGEAAGGFTAPRSVGIGWSSLLRTQIDSREIGRALHILISAGNLPQDETVRLVTKG